jgi:hypothetical protein
MRDIWAVPPGGNMAEIRATKGKSHLKAFVAGGLIILLGLGGGGLLRWMKQSTPVSAETALEEFRTQSAEVADTDASESGTNASKQGATKQRTKEKKFSKGRAATPTRPTDRQQAAASTPARGDSSRERVAAASPSRPEDGVYAWDVEGYEQTPGTRRELPERSHRVINYDGDNGWTEHHIFSEQKEQWFGIVISEEGVATTDVRNRVVMGPVTVDKTVVFNPPMFVNRFPMKVGAEWSGEWSGKTSGEYTAKTVDRTTLVIGDERVEVVQTEVRMQMRGDVEGTSFVRSWVAPDYSLVVKQYQETNVTSGPADYYCEWSGQVTSLHPQQ